MQGVVRFIGVICAVHTQTWHMLRSCVASSALLNVFVTGSGMAHFYAAKQSVWCCKAAIFLFAGTRTTQSADVQLSALLHCCFSPCLIKHEFCFWRQLPEVATVLMLAA
jgi:hypothetical protein